MRNEIMYREGCMGEKSGCSLLGTRKDKGGKEGLYGG